MIKKPKENTVLIIEDDIDIRKFACRTLELEGYRILQAATGEEGLKLLWETQVNLVLLDLRLPDISGWKILEQIKSEPEISAIPVVILTASVPADQRKQALTTGASDYLIKPLSVADLRNAMAKYLKSKR